MAHFFVSAAHKSSGKTTISIGLAAALRARGVVVQPFKKGPDYIDPLWLTAAAGRDCFNLDFYTMGHDEIVAAFSKALTGADIGLIEGNKGLYDGLDLHGSNSNAALARLLGSPVVLVIDARGMTRGIAPLVLGYQAFEPGISIAGVILNNLGGSRHESKLRSVIEHYTDVEVLGAVHRNDDLMVVERHLGLMPSNEADAAEGKTRLIGGIVSQQVNLDRLLEIAGSAQEPQAPRVCRSPGRGGELAPVRIGVLRDRAFGFYYPDDLAALREAGALLVEIDSLNDPELPDIDGLFIGGGFPEMHMESLERNGRFRESVLAFIESGHAVYAECGGLMYLCRTLVWRGKRCKMVGAIDADVIMEERPQGRGYVRLKETGASPWPAPDEAGDRVIYAHEFHYSRLSGLAKRYRYAYRVLRGTGIDGEHDGIVYKNLLAAYCHMRNVGGNRWCGRFVGQVRATMNPGAQVSDRS